MIELLVKLIKRFVGEDADCPFKASQDDSSYDSIDLENDGIGPDDLPHE